MNHIEILLAYFEKSFSFWFIILCSCGGDEVNVLSEQAEAIVIFDATELGQDGSFSLSYVQGKSFKS